ncbi:MAG: two component transcriptional regulator, winged helix family [Candidatus Angelobacter sp.]|nr:two component transcriptional regulator, winged helix family [Candidatus Angelobacter sp.]
MSILLADDDLHLTTFLSKSLESEGYSVHTALNEDSVLSELQRQSYKLIILDLNFGQTDGLKLLEKLRADGLETPVMVLSARNRVSDRIQSLNLGADDYITKPFSFQELAARTSALLRRKADPALSMLRVANLELDPSSRKAHRGEREIKLSPKEFDLLFLLMRHAGETLTRQDLLRDSWGLQPESDSNLVDVYVNYLRKKVDFADEDKLIHTVRGSGYRIGKPAPQGAGSLSNMQPNGGHADFNHAHQPSALAGFTDALGAQQTPLAALIHAMAHDLAQPLTSIRCFLEVMGMHKVGSSPLPAEIKTIEQQADRAIALAKGISALVREVPVPTGPWTSLDNLLNDVFNDFDVLLQSGLLTLERQWDPSVEVTSSPVLRNLMVLFLVKLVGRNTRPLVLAISAQANDGRCVLHLKWKPADDSQPKLLDAKNIIARELAGIQELVYSIGGEMSFPDEGAEILLKLPAATNAGRLDVVVH